MKFKTSQSFTRLEFNSIEEQTCPKKLTAHIADPKYTLEEQRITIVRSNFAAIAVVGFSNSCQVLEHLPFQNKKGAVKRVQCDMKALDPTMTSMRVTLLGKLSHPRLNRANVEIVVVWQFVYAVSFLSCSSLYRSC